MTIKLANKSPLGKMPKEIMMVKPVVPDNLANEWIRTEFNLPLSLVNLCDEYFMRVWTGSYVAESVQDGILYARADDWIVHYQSTPEIVKNSPTVACSFRKYQGKNYVVIKIWKSNIADAMMENE